jgi:hypothetical protein
MERRCPWNRGWVLSNSRIRLQEEVVSLYHVSGVYLSETMFEAGVSGRMVVFRRKSEVYRDEWAASRTGHGIVENPLSYCQTDTTDVPENRLMQIFKIPLSDSTAAVLVVHGGGEPVYIDRIGFL